MPTPIFAHLHSSPLVVRRRSGANWRSLSPHAGASGSSSGLEAVELIDVKAERLLLLQTLRESRRRLAWHSEVADLHAFRKVLSFGCRALHFSGHGVPGQVIFETRKGEAQFVSQQELQDLLLAGGAESHRRPRRKRDKKKRNLQNRRQKLTESGDESSTLSPPPVHDKPKVPLQLVFVSACHSESVAQAFVSAGVPHVVVVSKEEKVLDRKAMEFAKAFYTALFAGHSVAKMGGPSEFKLLGDGDHNDAPFRDVPVGDCVETDMGGRRGGKVTVNECDAVAEVFVGRSLEVHQVYKSLVEGARLVSITGERGIGKTEVALQCAQYASERRVFSHIFYLRLNTGDGGQDSSDDACSHLADPSVLVNGCNRAQRQNLRFRAIVATLLRRVNSLALLLTGDGKFGAMDGVGEKIIPVGPLPPADAALLFTLRAPRKIKAHEMGGSTDLEAFGEHPVIKCLQGHPRTICAVSQFLEKKDMELDQHEFLSYIIPSVNTGLCLSKVVRQLQALRDVPLDWVAPQVSCFFATKLKGDAATRPLSTRSIDFLSKSSLIWGRGCAAPAQRGGAFVPVTWQPEREGWFVALQGESNAGGAESNGVTFPTLQELILSVNVLKFLFPQTPKEAAFTLQT
uniref:CHAT domain-containing protein n=1 Tax=Phytophthora ramorum TaxID=164328 RepID=H3HEB6_PHYRM